MSSLNKLTNIESGMSQEICQMLFGLHDIEHESWFSPYGGPNQLQNEVCECRGLMQSILKDINFGSKEIGKQKFIEFMEKSGQMYPASINLVYVGEREKDVSNGHDNR